jgi:hypothetical protein
LEGLGIEAEEANSYLAINVEQWDEWPMPIRKCAFGCFYPIRKKSVRRKRGYIAGV